MQRPAPSGTVPTRAMVLVGAGAATGAAARWAIAGVADTGPGQLPWATLLVNVVGCLAIGVAARRVGPATDTWFVAVTGVIGGFTTWSTFANEARSLTDDGHPVLAAVYLGVTVGAGLVAVELGRRAAR